MLIGSENGPIMNVREVPFEVLYPTIPGGNPGEGNHLAAEVANFEKHLGRKVYVSLMCRLRLRKPR